MEERWPVEEEEADGVTAATTPPSTAIDRRRQLKIHSYSIYPSDDAAASIAPYPFHHNYSSSADEIRFPSNPSAAGETLPEFTGTGGGAGIFKLPVRAALHPGRPPALELRPHPLRETQIGSFLRTIACTKTQLWAGQHTGLRCWDLSRVFEASASKQGDEQTAPFLESCRTPPTLCLAVDPATGLIWSGHKDGKIRSWKLDQSPDSEDGNVKLSPFKEQLSWQAHRAPVLSLVITSYGDIWSGSEGGSIKAWPWEAIEKSLTLTSEERHMAALLVERSYIDLRMQATMGGVYSLPAVDVKFLLSDNSRSRVWSGGNPSFALWDSRSKELLKVFGIDGQVETKLDGSNLLDLYAEDETKAKLVSTSKKEKSQGPVGFFQRLMGAADAVMRGAVKGTFGEDNRRTEALTIAMDGTIWTGSTNGSLAQWDGNGNRLQEVQHHPHPVHCICAFGTRLWVGYASGKVQVMDLEGNLIGGWVAHSSPVIKMSVGGSYIFSLANHGGIRGWNLTSPGPLDNILRTELASKEMLYTKKENLKILVGTWNVGQERASRDSMISWLGCAASEAGLVVVGLQEVEMGAGFLALSAAKETVGLEGSANGQWWLDTIGKTLDEGTSFERVGSRQLAGLLISAWARKNLKSHIGDADVAAVPCGFVRAIGNKMLPGTDSDDMLPDSSSYNINHPDESEDVDPYGASSEDKPEEDPEEDPDLEIHTQSLGENIPLEEDVLEQVGHHREGIMYEHDEPYEITHDELYNNINPYGGTSEEDPEDDIHNPKKTGFKDLKGKKPEERVSHECLAAKGNKRIIFIQSLTGEFEDYELELPEDSSFIIQSISEDIGDSNHRVEGANSRKDGSHAHKNLDTKLFRDASKDIDEDVWDDIDSFHI